MARNTEKLENEKNTHFRTWIMARKLKNVLNETQTVFDMKYGEKHSKMWKMRNPHCSAL
jgi:hypothetical protein